jgi:hypothetical protein
MKNFEEGQRKMRERMAESPGVGMIKVYDPLEGKPREADLPALLLRH